MAGGSAKRSHERRDRLARALAATEGSAPANGLCGACADFLGMPGASLMVIVAGAPSLLCASDPLSRRLEDVQHTLGEGPCLDAHRTGRPVSEPDLAQSRRARWPAFGVEALAAGAAALFSYPMRVGAVGVGALSLYRSRAGDLSGDQAADAQAMAEVAAGLVLALQAQARGSALSADLEALAGYRAEVHQASGMVSVQLEVSVGEAMVRLRAYAFANARPLADVAGDVVARRLRLDA